MRPDFRHAVPRIQLDVALHLGETCDRGRDGVRGFARPRHRIPDDGARPVARPAAHEPLPLRGAPLDQSPLRGGALLARGRNPRRRLRTPHNLDSGNGLDTTLGRLGWTTHPAQRYENDVSS